jgi:hypothetical protein
VRHLNWFIGFLWGQLGRRWANIYLGKPWGDKRDFVLDLIKRLERNYIDLL